MTPPAITSIQHLYYLAEEFDQGDDATSEGSLSTVFGYVDDEDRVYFGQIAKPKLLITFEEYRSALEPIPDEDIYPAMVEGIRIYTSPENSNLDEEGLYIKRPPLQSYHDYKEQGCLEIMGQTLMQEITALQLISQHEQHPNIVGYHGCRTRRGRITGIVLDRYQDTLHQVFEPQEEDVDQMVEVDKEAIIRGLESAVSYLHRLGLAHNDINPSNVMVNRETGEAVLIDFGSCCRIGEPLGASCGTEGWMECRIEDYTHSKESHDLYALEKIRSWLENGGSKVEEGHPSCEPRSSAD